MIERPCAAINQVGEDCPVPGRNYFDIGEAGAACGIWLCHDHLMQLEIGLDVNVGGTASTILRGESDA